MENSTKNLKDMTLEELRELRNQRYDQACRDDSIDKCYIVATEMGTQLEEIVSHSYFGQGHLWQGRDGLEIFVDYSSKDVTARYKGRKVMSTRTHSRFFVPGDWMKIVEMEYLLALAKKSAREAARNEKERQALIASMESV